jgi:ATP-dependent DNA ligase
LFTCCSVPSRPVFPTKASQPPSGPLWVHEIKHDGFRIIGRKDRNRVRLYSRPGNDLTYRFPLIVEAGRRRRRRVGALSLRIGNRRQHQCLV